MNTTLIIFILLNVVNVILQTIKSLCTYKCGKTIAAITNAIAYGLYTVVLVYMQCELTTLQKAVIVGGCNLIGVYIVKTLEEKTSRKIIYKVEFTVDNDTAKKILTTEKLKHYNKSVIEDWTVFNFYAETKPQLKKVEEIIKKYNGKYIITRGEQFKGV